MNTNKMQGFTLIELMIVVAIIAILAAIALPAYQDYVARSQVTAGLAEVRGGVTAYEEMINRGTGTPNNANLGIQASTARCSAITVTGTAVADGGQKIECTLVGNPKISGKKIDVSRNASGAWKCTTDADTKYKPGGCA